MYHKDDGETAWYSTELLLVLNDGRVVRAEVRNEGYTGEALAIIKRDDIGLPENLLKRLCVHVFWNHRDPDSDVTETSADLEILIKDLFYRVDAEVMVRKFRSMTACSSRMTGLNDSGPAAMDN